MLASCMSAVPGPMGAHPVRVEVDVGAGLPFFGVVGRAEASVLEARTRVRGALDNAGYEFPRRRVVVALAPAEVPKTVPLDLPIALAVLVASKQLKIAGDLGRWAALGELSLEGGVDRVRGVLASMRALRADGVACVLVPAANAGEAGLVGGIDAIGVATVREAADWLAAKAPRRRAAARTDAAALLAAADDPDAEPATRDLADVRGQARGRRAIELAAAGAHSMLLVGPPGAGKSMLASRLPGVLPPMTVDEALEVTAIHSFAGSLPDGGSLVARRPFRAPHHGMSAAALVGGGSRVPRPGEVSLAHHGVLFLDELAEFARPVIEALRQPLEDGVVTVSRVGETVTFPARAQLVAAMNPCLCRTPEACECHPARVDTYRAKVSGPVLDRIDLRVDLPRLDRASLLGDLSADGSGDAPEGSAAVRARVVAARERQQLRQGRPNAHLAGRDVRLCCALEPSARRLLADAVARLALTGRGVDRALRVARTVADLAGAPGVTRVHLAEALSLRGTVEREAIAA